MSSGIKRMSFSGVAGMSREQGETSTFSELEALTASVVPSTARRTRICDGLTEFTFEPGRQMVMVGRALGVDPTSNTTVMVGGGLCCVVACVDRVDGLRLNDRMDRMELGDGRGVDVWCRDYSGLHGAGRVMVSFTVDANRMTAGGLAEGALRHVVAGMTTRAD